MDAEAARANSVLSRAQALLVAQAFLGALLSLGDTVVGHLEAFSFWRSSLLGIVALYLVIQTVLLTVSALRALSGVPFPAIGSSDLLAMLSSPADDIVRQMTLQMLLHYRTAANLNTWRFSHLSNAQTALRNTAIALAVLVVFTLALSVFAAPKPPAPGLVVKLPRSEIAVVGAGPSPLSDARPTPVRTEQPELEPNLGRLTRRPGIERGNAPSKGADEIGDGGSWQATNTFM